MAGLSACFPNAFVRLFGKGQLVGFPEITVTLASFVGGRNLLPQFATGCLAAISKHKGHDLASSAAHNDPQPAFVPFLLDKGPQFIGFQDIIGLSRQECLFKFWIGLVFFFCQEAKVGRLTPKVR